MFGVVTNPNIDVRKLLSFREPSEIVYAENLGHPECHIFKENKLKMAKHTNCVPRYIQLGAADLSKKFHGASRIIESHSNCCRSLTKKRKAEDSSVLLYDDSAGSQIQLCYVPSSPVLIQSDSNRNLVRAGFVPAKQVHLSSGDSFLTNENASNYNGLTSIQTSAIGSKTTTKSTTSQGDYAIVVGELLRSSNESYEVLSFLGRGTFGQVVKCRCSSSKRLVAIKILKNLPSYLRQGNVEIQILQTLSQQDTESHNIVRAIECFQHKNHMCFVFELLEQNLYEYLKSNKFRPLSLPEIRPIAQQVLTALSKLKSLGLIHADLKPENIMLVSSTTGALRYRVKVIDFGSACHSSKAVQNTYLQSRYYRAPEILLGLPFNEAIDMWSLGCVLAELFLGWPLYPGSSEYDQMRYIVDTQGLPPPDLLQNAAKCNNFFIRDPYNCDWRIKTQMEYALETGQQPKEARKYFFSSLGQICDVSVLPQSDDPDYEFERDDRLQFASLLQLMLKMRPSERVVPDSALLHPFITMIHLQAHSFSQRFHESVNLMQVCSEVARRKQLLGFRSAMQSFSSLPSLSKNVVTSVLPPSQTVTGLTLIEPNKTAAYLPTQSVTGHQENAVAYYAAAAVAALSKPTFRLPADRATGMDCSRPSYKVGTTLSAASKQTFAQSGNQLRRNVDLVNDQLPSEAVYLRTFEERPSCIPNSVSLYDLVAASGNALSLFNAAVTGPVATSHHITPSSQSRSQAHLSSRTCPQSSNQQQFVEVNHRPLNSSEKYLVADQSENASAMFGSFLGQNCSRQAEPEPYLTVTVDPRTNTLIETNCLRDKLSAIVQRQQQLQLCNDSTALFTVHQENMKHHQQQQHLLQRYPKAVIISSQRNDLNVANAQAFLPQTLHDSCQRQSPYNPTVPIPQPTFFQVSNHDAIFHNHPHGHPSGLHKPIHHSPVNSVKLLNAHEIAGRYPILSQPSYSQAFTHSTHPICLPTMASSGSPIQGQPTVSIQNASASSDLLPINLVTGSNAAVRTTSELSTHPDPTSINSQSRWGSEPKISHNAHSTPKLVITKPQSVKNLLLLDSESPLVKSISYSYMSSANRSDTSVSINESASVNSMAFITATPKSEASTMAEECKHLSCDNFVSVPSHQRSDKKIPIGRVQPMIKQEDVPTSTSYGSRMLQSPLSLSSLGVHGSSLLNSDLCAAQQQQQQQQQQPSSHTTLDYIPCAPAYSSAPTFHAASPELSASDRLQFARQSFPRADPHVQSTRQLSAAHAAAAAYHNLMYFQLKQQQQHQDNQQGMASFPNAQNLNGSQYCASQTSSGLSATPDAWAASYYAAAAAAAELELLFNQHSVNLRPCLP